jgi:hypothetical protein
MDPMLLSVWEHWSHLGYVDADILVLVIHLRAQPRQAARQCPRNDSYSD